MTDARSPSVAHKWIPMANSPRGAGGQVWVAYRNPYHPNGWNLRVQWTPIVTEHAIEPEFWMPIDYPNPPPKEIAND